MTTYLAHVKCLHSTFNEFNIVQVPRLENSHVDALASLGSSAPVMASQSIPLLYLQCPAVWKDPPTEVTTIKASDSWMTPILHYLSDELSFDKNVARCLWAKSARFTILDVQLLRRSLLGPYLKFVTPTKASCILSEHHQGECGNHAGDAASLTKPLQ